MSKGYAVLYHGEETTVLAVGEDPRALAAFAQRYLEKLAVDAHIEFDVDRIVPEDVVEGTTVAAIAHVFKGCNDWFDIVTIEEAAFVV